jgi:phosphoribosylanthranilate isomerase
MVKLKICGLRRLEDIEVVNKYRPIYVGFVFAKSKRQVSLEEAKKLKAALHPDIKAVGVFVNETIENICLCAKAGVIDYIQLHGDEDGEYIIKLKQEIKLPIIKAIRVGNEHELIDQLEAIKCLPIEYYLFDTYTTHVYGGSGESFNWHMIKELAKSHIHKPYFLAGGIGSDNLKEAIAENPYAIDISSKVETNGFKDEAKIKEVIEILQSEQI